MSQNLDTEREIVTLNGRTLRLVSRTTDGMLVLQAMKSRTIVITDVAGCIDGKEYAVNREALKFRHTAPRGLTPLTPGQPVFCFRYSKRHPCLLRAVFVGNVSKSGHYCKIVMAQSVAGRDILKVPRQQLFEDLGELRAWVTRIDGELGELVTQDQGYARGQDARGAPPGP